MADTTYNGWTNRETWLVGESNIIDYDQVKEALELVIRLGYRHYEKYLEVRHSRSGEERALTLWLSDWLKDYHEDVLYDILDFEKINPYIRDFTNFGAINWLEIAEHYDQEIKEALSKGE